jgi:hypothetical protein
MYNIQTLSFDMLPTSYYSKPSVYVISDSEWTEYKRQQSLSEIKELNKLIASHEQAIDRLKESRSLMEQQFSTDKEATE